MVHLFKRSLPQHLGVECGIDASMELFGISRTTYGKIVQPTLAETQAIAQATLLGLEHVLTVKPCDGEISRKGDLFLEFPPASHFMILSQHPDHYIATVSIGWRGRSQMTPQERAQYTAFLQRYFRV